VMDEPTYRCLDCLDTAVKLTMREDASGRKLGWFGSPCQCQAGEAKRASWQKANEHGRSFADSAMDVTEALRKRGAM